MLRIHRREFGSGLLVLWLTLPAGAADFSAGNMRVTEARSSPTPPVATVGAVYFSLTNTGPKSDRLTAITSAIASRVEIHESRRVQGMIQMRALSYVECPASATVKIEPGGMHIMLVGLTRPLSRGMQFPMSLSFRDSGIMNIMVIVSAQE